MHRRRRIANEAARLGRGGAVGAGGDARLLLVGARGSQFRNNYSAEMWSGSAAVSYLRLIDLFITQTLGSRVIEKKKKGASGEGGVRGEGGRVGEQAK